MTALGLQMPRMPRKRKDGSPGFIAAQPWLARGFVRFVGEAVAFVVAETLEQAKDAAELIEVEYETLPAIVSTEQAILPGARAVWEKCPDNIAFYQEWGNKAAVDAAIAKADHVVRHRMVINRITANTMEPRGCLAEFDTHDDRYVIRCTIQAPHRTRAAMAGMLKMPETRIRVIADNVGGGFGMKGAIFPEYIVVPVAAKLVGRPVKWICERSEGLLVRRAFARQRRRCRIRARPRRKLPRPARENLCRHRRLSHVRSRRRSAARQYRLPRCDLHDASLSRRSVGRDDAHAAHRALSRRRAARKRLHDRDHDRSRRARARHRQGRAAAAQHRFRPRRCRTRPALVYTFDSGDFPKNLEQCLHMADYAGFAARREEARRRGKLRGIGVSNTVEATASGLLEHAEMRFDPTGTLTLADGDARSRPGPCDDLQADGVRQARHRFRSHQVQLRRHRQRAHRHRHIRIALGRMRRQRGA